MHVLLMNKKRLYYFLAIILLIIIGISSRKFTCIPSQAGDAIWAMMVFCLGRFLFVKMKLWKVALLSLAFSFIDEFAQLIQWSWLVELRSTTLGHLLLGQGFLWEDLIAYVVGIGVMCAVASWAEEKMYMN